MSLEIKTLDWDSKFFNKKIASVHLTEFKKASFLKTLQKAKTNEIKLLYVFCHKDVILPDSFLNSVQGIHADTKLTFEGLSKPYEVMEYDSYSSNLELINLAFISGEHSRFNRDKKNFSRQEFERLYKEWINKSISKDLADKIYVTYYQSKISGFITLKTNKKGIGEVGLISVNPEIQGKGVGSDLLNKGSDFFFRNGIKQIQIPTQKQNDTACQFYRKHNFHVTHAENVYHITL